MRFVVASDEALPVVDHVATSLRKRGHDVHTLAPSAWASCAINVAHEVANGKADAGVIFCHTGTGVSIAANKVRGIRAALCTDAATAAGARKWNDANVLALSLRLTTVAVADEILDAWLATPYGKSEEESLETIRDEEGDKHRP
jgi:ribose 5-phosphate isomerase B